MIAPLFHFCFFYLFYLSIWFHLRLAHILLAKVLQQIIATASCALREKRVPKRCPWGTIATNDTLFSLIIMFMKKEYPFETGALLREASFLSKYFPIPIEITYKL